MFTPENFYFVIRENLNLDGNHMLWIPRTNGEKDFDNLCPMADRTNWILRGYRQRYEESCIVMYDQEPLFPSADAIYRQIMYDQTDPCHHWAIDELSYAEIFVARLRNANIPIWCHSELNSTEISDLIPKQFVPCYYWYHAFIARDWFRHWQYNQNLQPVSKNGAPFRFLLYARDLTGSRSYRKHLVDSLAALKNQILYQWEDQKHLSPALSAMIDSDDAGRSAVHLVAETLFDTTKVYLTEKVFKPMVMSQPFIIWGPPKTLQTLRNYGFQTFNHVWNEEYDTITDSDQRMVKLLEVVHKISQLSTDEFAKMYEHCLPAIEHNRQWFFSDKFMDLCWSELTANMHKALAHRQDLLEQHPGGQLVYAVNNKSSLLNIPTIKAALAHYVLTISPTTSQKIAKSYPGLIESVLESNQFQGHHF